MKTFLFFLIAVLSIGCMRERTGDESPQPPTPLTRDDQVQKAVFEYLIDRNSQPLYFLALDEKKPHDPSPSLFKQLRSENKRVRLHSECTLTDRARETSTQKAGAILVVTIQRWQNDAAVVKGECMPGPLSGGSFTGRVVHEADRWVVRPDTQQVIGK